MKVNATIYGNDGQRLWVGSQCHVELAEDFDLVGAGPERVVSSRAVVVADKEKEHVRLKAIIHAAVDL